jgi:uncharacterized membrane protein YfcA
MPLDTIGLVLCLLISFVAAAIHGVIGFGFNFLAAPILILMYPQLVPAPIIIDSTILACMVGWNARKDIERSVLPWSVAGCALGAFLAAFAITLLSGRLYDALFGSTLLLAVILSLLGWRPNVNATSTLAAGGISGFMGTITSIGGPPIALLFQHMPAAKLRGTISAYFLITSPLALAALYVAGRLGWAELKLSVVLLPGMLLGYACSRFLVPFLDQQATRIVVLVISTLGGLILLARLW